MHSDHALLTELGIDGVGDRIAIIRNIAKHGGYPPQFSHIQDRIDAEKFSEYNKGLHKRPNEHLLRN
jgi:hypothetical protein